jgi:hypothetical protein
MGNFKATYTGVARWFIFKQKYQFGYILRALEWKMSRYNLWQFGTACSHLVHFSHFGMFGPRKIWQPWATLALAFALKNSIPSIACPTKLVLPPC